MEEPCSIVIMHVRVKCIWPIVIIYYHSLCLCTATELHCRTRDDMGRRTLKGKYLTILTYQMWPQYTTLWFINVLNSESIVILPWVLSFSFQTIACFIDPISYAIDPIICLFISASGKDTVARVVRLVIIWSVPSKALYYWVTWRYSEPEP